MDSTQSPVIQQYQSEDSFYFFLNSGNLQNLIKKASVIYTEKFFRTGDKYIGDMFNGKMHGLGTYYFSSGSKLTCTFLNGIARGKGIYEHPANYIYTGDIYMNKKHGKGREQLDNGDEFIGEFFYGERKRGVYKSMEGFEYHGYFSKNKMDGFGVLIHNENGYFFQGYFKDDKKHGHGIEYLADIRQWKQGYWSNNEFLEPKEKTKWRDKWKQLISFCTN